MDAGDYILLADYEGFGWLVFTAIVSVLGGCVLFGAAIATSLAIATGNRRKLWWTPALSLLGFLLFLVGVLVFRGP